MSLWKNELRAWFGWHLITRSDTYEDIKDQHGLLFMFILLLTSFVPVLIFLYKLQKIIIQGYRDIKQFDYWFYGSKYHSQGTFFDVTYLLIYAVFN